MDAVQGKWPVEPVTLFVFSYYPTNGMDESPTYNSNLLANYNEAVTASQEYIITQGNEGVCIIQPITATMIFPFQAWEAF